MSKIKNTISITVSSFIVSISIILIAISISNIVRASSKVNTSTLDAKCTNKDEITQICTFKSKDTKGYYLIGIIKGENKSFDIYDLLVPLRINTNEPKFLYIIYSKEIIEKFGNFNTLDKNTFESIPMVDFDINQNFTLVD